MSSAPRSTTTMRAHLALLLARLELAVGNYRSALREIRRARRLSQSALTRRRGVGRRCGAADIARAIDAASASAAASASVMTKYTFVLAAATVALVIATLMLVCLDLIHEPGPPVFINISPPASFAR
jgi:hypothetical protein